MISGHVDNIEMVLMEDRVPSDLATAESFLKEHMVCIMYFLAYHIATYVRIFYCSIYT